MCESKRVSLINSKNAWHKLFTHRLKTPSEKSQNRTKRDDAVSRFFLLHTQPVSERGKIIWFSMRAELKCVSLFSFTLLQQEIMVLSKIGLSFSINPSSSLQAVSHSLCVWMQWHFCFLFALLFSFIEIYQSRSIFDVWQYCLLRIRLFFSLSAFCFCSVAGQWIARHAANTFF